MDVGWLRGKVTTVGTTGAATMAEMMTAGLSATQGRTTWAEMTGKEMIVMTTEDGMKTMAVAIEAGLTAEGAIDPNEQHPRGCLVLRQPLAIYTF